MTKKTGDLNISSQVRQVKHQYFLQQRSSLLNRVCLRRMASGVWRCQKPETTLPFHAITIALTRLIDHMGRGASGGLRTLGKQFSRGAMEAAIDIAINAGNLITTSQININDSRDMVNYIIERAEAFERSPLRDGNDYITEIDAFAEHFLKHKYGESDRCSTGKCGHPLKYNQI